VQAKNTESERKKTIQCLCCELVPEMKRDWIALESTALVTSIWDAFRIEWNLALLHVLQSFQ